jgi:hypothetical protein
MAQQWPNPRARARHRPSSIEASFVYQSVSSPIGRRGARCDARHGRRTRAHALLSGDIQLLGRRAREHAARAGVGLRPSV